MLLAMEDLHWVDSTTRDFLGLLVEAIRDRRIFALITYRPEVDPPWSNLPHLTTLTLNHLTSVECRKLVRGLESAQSLPDELVEQIVSRTDGVPLFVEELLRTVLESGADSGEAIPETLRDALTARLDRLGDAKRVAQLASVIGRVFPFGVLQAATDVSTEVLRGSLDQLVSSGLVYRRTLTGGDDFAFKHALIRDCAYQSLLRDERRDLHRGVANALESARAGIPIPPEVIARHFADGGAPERALPLWQKAGEEAEGRGAYSEALVHFDAAMASLGDAPTEARVLLALGQARCQHFLGQRAVALDALTQHSDSVDPVGSPELAGRFFAFLGRMQAFEGLREASLASLQQAIRAASSCGDVLTEGNACALLGRDQMQRGHLDTSLEYFEKAERLLRPLGPSWDLGDAYFRYGYVFANLTNEFDRALTTAEELAKVAEHLDDDRLRTSSLMIRGTAMMWLGDWVSAEKSFVEGIALAPNEYERILAKGYAAMFYLESGDVDAAMPLIEDELKGLGQYRSQEIRCTAINHLAMAYRLLGRREEARAQAQSALSLGNELDNPYNVLTSTQTLGLIAREDGDPNSAANYLRQALEIANTGFGPVWTGACQLELARVLFEAQEVPAATAALVEAHAAFSKCGAQKYIDRAQNLATDRHIELARSSAA